MTREEQNDLVRMLLVRLDRHLPGEKAHAERVAVYATAIAFELGLRDDDLLAVRWAAEMHDIGKLAISRSFFIESTSRDPVVQAERRAHVLFGASILKPISFLAPLSRWIRLHHERIDGSGYPFCKFGDEIPIQSQIIGAAEWFDVRANGSYWGVQGAGDDALMAMATEPFASEIVTALKKIHLLVQPVLTHPSA